MQKCALGGQYQYSFVKTMDSLDMFDLHQSQGVGDCVEQGGTGYGCPYNKVLAHFHEIKTMLFTS